MQSVPRSAYHCEAKIDAGEDGIESCWAQSIESVDSVPGTCQNQECKWFTWWDIAIYCIHMLLANVSSNILFHHLSREVCTTKPKATGGYYLRIVCCFLYVIGLWLDLSGSWEAWFILVHSLGTTDGTGLRHSMQHRCPRSSSAASRECAWSSGIVGAGLRSSLV